MPSIHALLIAIDEYPNPQHRLSGCVNDLKAFQSYLETNAGTDQFDGIHIKTLTNKAANLKNVIDRFDVFSEASAGDICVLYYCGHGSQSPAPKEFWHLAPSHMNESILCWDSRMEGGRDLMDKELSYLIWNATKEVDVQFVIIMDCCHSGSNTRTPGLTARMADPATRLVAAEDYLGYSHYKKTNGDAGLEVSPPRGKYIHLAAAKNTETAKELRIDGVSRGIFTYSILEALRESGNILSYGELINRTGIKIRNKVAQQSPQVEASNTGDLQLPFLGGIKTNINKLLVSYDKTHGWLVNAGAVQGIKLSFGDNKTLLQLEDHPEQPLQITKVLPNQSLVSGLDNFSKDKIFNAKLIQNAASKITLALDDDERLDAISKLIGDDDPFIKIISEQDAPRYLLHSTDEGFQLKTSGKDGFTFMSTDGHSRDAALFFIGKLENLARWAQLLELSNPATSIRSNELKVELYKNMDPGNLEDDTKVKAVNWVFSGEFEYVYTNDWQQPAFQLKISNTGQRTLWVSALYMGFDFSITNHLLAKQELKPGETVWLADLYEGYPYKTIPLQIDDMFYQAGLRKITDYIKIIASTDEINTESYNQERLFEESESLEVTRGMGRRSRPVQADWITWEIALKIVREMEETEDGRPEAGEETEDGSPEAEEEMEDGSPEAEESDDAGVEVISPSAPPPPSPSSSSGKVGIEDEFEVTRGVRDIPDKEWEAPPGKLSTIDDNNKFPDFIQQSPIATQVDEVDCSAYAPPQCEVGDDLFIQVWLHLPEQKAMADDKAKEFDEDAVERAFQSLSLPIQKNDELTLVLTAKGIDLDETTQSIRWNGSLQSIQFIASIPEEYAKNKIIFTLRVFKEDIPIGHLKFMIKVEKQVEEHQIVKQALGTEAKQYKKAFISYASKDRNEVLKRVQMLDKLGITFFQDLINLNPGERWEQKLYENIDNADLFLLFWSTAAKESKWVLKELQYAISLKQNEDDHMPVIQPVPIEGPPIVYPPEELGHMHFNDRILYFIVKE